jgi:hypothetical protein
MEGSKLPTRALKLPFVVATARPRFFMRANYDGQNMPTAPVAGSRKVSSAAKQGSGSDPATLSTICCVTGPDTRNTASAARPAPETMAKIVSPGKRVDAGVRTSRGNQPCEADGAPIGGMIGPLLLMLGLVRTNAASATSRSSRRAAPPSQSTRLTTRTSTERMPRRSLDYSGSNHRPLGNIRT